MDTKNLIELIVGNISHKGKESSTRFYNAGFMLGIALVVLVIYVRVDV